MKWVLMVLFVFCAVFAQAQSASSPQSRWQSALKSIKAGWSRVIQEGRPAAERLVKLAPEKYKDIKIQIGHFTEKLAKTPEVKAFQDKKDLVLELWRIRASLDLLALLDSDNLKAITGMEPPKFKRDA